MYSVNIIHIVFLESKYNFSLMVARKVRGYKKDVTLNGPWLLATNLLENYSNKFSVLQYVYLIY